MPDKVTLHTASAKVLLQRSAVLLEKVSKLAVRCQKCWLQDALQELAQLGYSSNETAAPSNRKLRRRIVRS